MQSDSMKNDECAAPAAKIEQAIRSSWIQLLGHQSYELGSTWDDAGGNSITSLEMLLALEQKLGGHIPEDLMAADFTPATLASRLEDHYAGRTRSRSSAGGLSQIFVLPAYSVKDIGAGRLAHALRSDLDPVLLDYEIDQSSWASPTELDALATRCEQRILMAAPAGPIHLLGRSWGGGLAFELACRFHAAGRKVGFLGILDRIPFGTSRTQLLASATWKVRYGSHAQRNRYTVGGALRLIVRQLVRFGGSDLLAGGMEILRRPAFKKLFDFVRKNIGEVTRETHFRSGYYPGRVWLFRTSGPVLVRDELPEDLGWGAHCSAVTIVPIPGDHETILLEENLGVVCERVLAAAKEAIGGTSVVSAVSDGAVKMKDRRGAEPAVAALVLVSQRGATLPINSLIDERVFQVRHLAVEQHDSNAPLPDHGLLFNAISDADICPAELEMAATIARRSSAPVINPPERVRLSGRIENGARLRHLPGIVVPRFRLYPRSALAAEDAADALMSDGYRFPLLLRTPGHQWGRHFTRVTDPSDLQDAVENLPGDHLMAIEYVDVRRSDGKWRKFRVMVVDGKLYPLHLAISNHWKIHYFSADMADRPEHRAEEAAFLQDMDGFLGARAMATLKGVAEELGLDYFGIDFALNADGHVALFEANAMMIVAVPPPGNQWDYRRPPAQRVKTEVHQMLLDRVAAARSAAK